MPQKPRRGQKTADVVNATWLGKLWDCVKYNLDGYKGDGRTIMVKDRHITLIRQRSSATSGGGDKIRWAKITAATDTWTYTADIYDNLDDDPVETGVTVKVLTSTLAAGETIDIGECVPVREQSHGTGEGKASYWTVLYLNTWAG